jgi:hypothetical protein
VVVACCSHKTLPFATCKCVDYNGKIEFYDLSAMLRVRVNTESRKKMGTIRVTMCKGGFFSTVGKFYEALQETIFTL